MCYIVLVFYNLKTKQTKDNYQNVKYIPFYLFEPPKNLTIC